MKYLVIVTIALFAFAAADDKWEPRRDPFVVHDICLKKTGMTDEQVEQITDIFQNDETKEYVFCSMKENGFFSEEHGYYLDRVLAHMKDARVDSDEARAVITKCIKSKEENSTPKERALQGLKCMKDNNFDDIVQKTAMENNVKVG